MSFGKACIFFLNLARLICLTLVYVDSGHLFFPMNKFSQKANLANADTVYCSKFDNVYVLLYSGTPIKQTPN